MLLLVKGSTADACAAAAARGIKLEHDAFGRLLAREHIAAGVPDATRRDARTAAKRAGVPAGTCRVYCSNADAAAVSSWFNEAPHVAPFPAGTLLHYQPERLTAGIPAPKE